MLDHKLEAKRSSLTEDQVMNLQRLTTFSTFTFSRMGSEDELLPHAATPPKTDQEVESWRQWFTPTWKMILRVLMVASLVGFLISIVISFVNELQVAIWDTQEQRLTRVVMPAMGVCSPGFLGQGFLSPRPTCFSPPGFYCAALYSLAPTTSRNPPFPVSDTPLVEIDVVENEACITLGLPPYPVEFDAPNSLTPVTMTVFLNATAPFDVYLFDPTTNSTSIEIYRNITGVPTRDEYYRIFFEPKVRVSLEFDPRPDNRFNYISLTLTPQLYVGADGAGHRSYLATTSTRHHPLFNDTAETWQITRLDVQFPPGYFETIRKERTSFDKLQLNVIKYGGTASFVVSATSILILFITIGINLFTALSCKRKQEVLRKQGYDSV